MAKDKTPGYDEVNKIIADAAKRIEEINELIKHVPQDTPSPILKPPGTPPGNKVPGSRAQRIRFLNEQKADIITKAKQAYETGKVGFSQEQQKTLSDLLGTLTNPDSKSYDDMITKAQERAISKIKDYQKSEGLKTKQPSFEKEDGHIPELSGMGSKFIDSLSYSKLPTAEEKITSKDQKEVQSKFLDNKSDLFEDR